MALFDKFFSTKRKLDGNRGSRDRSSHEITLEQVRLLLFKECDWRGRKLLFDSSTIEKVPAGKHERTASKDLTEPSTVIEISEGFAYVYKGPAQDASTLGEMIFGAVAMNYRGVSLKIHIMDDPQRLMCTKVFCVPATRKSSKVERKASASDQYQDRMKSCGDLTKGSKPLNMSRHQTLEDMSLSFSFDRNDSGFYGEHSPHSSVSSTYDYFSMLGIWDGNSQDDLYSFHSPPGRKMSSSSNGSWQRRTFRSVATRFELGNHSGNMLAVPTASTNLSSCDSQFYNNSSGSGTCDSLSSASSAVSVQRKNKLGLALLITVTDSSQLDLVQRCVQHSPQLQALVCRLRLATLSAGSGSGFVATLYQAAAAAARWLSDVVYGPRVEPAWLTMVTSQQDTVHKLADTLIADLCSVLTMADTKHTNFFISTLLTHVLTYHLGWVTTVSPYDRSTETQNRESDVNRPYNALWAQLADLCGNIGFPPRTARTILYGTDDQQFLNKLLGVLTYFIRCGEVRRMEFDFVYNKAPDESVVFVDADVQPKCCGLKRTPTCANKLDDKCQLKVPDSDSGSTLVPREVSSNLNISESLSNSSVLKSEQYDKPMTSQLRRTPTNLLSLQTSSVSSLSSLEDAESDQKVVFVLGDDEKLVGLKNKSGGGKSVKKSSKVHIEPLNLEMQEDSKVRSCESPSKCCAQQSQHSKPMKHSGFKFEFDKYPQIVTNYMKSKNLEILDRHYIGKPGNLKLDNFQFDPTVVPPLAEERCEACYKCQLLESTLQTPTNASELEYMNDVPRQTELQYATIVESQTREFDTKTFVRKRKENTVVVNVTQFRNDNAVDGETRKVSVTECKEKLLDVKRVIEIPMAQAVEQPSLKQGSGFDNSLLGGVTSHYVPDLILQGTLAPPKEWERDLKRDLDITSYLNKSLDAPVQAVAIIADTNIWEVSVRGAGRECVGMSALVGAMLDTLPHMRRASLPAAHCLSFIEGKLREFCVLSKTLAEMLMSTDFLDMATLTKALNIDVNDVPLLLAVATTHTPQVARRYGISFR